MTKIEQLEALLPLVSSRCGVIRDLQRREKSDDEPAYPIIFDAMLSHYDFRKAEPIERGSCGKGWTEEDAMLGAIGESIEHYCASHPAVKLLRRAVANELDGPWVAPTDFTLFSDEQYGRKDFPFRKWRVEDAIEWLQVLELPSREKVWVPAELIYLNYRGDQPQDALCAATSSGLAAGPTLERAIRSAVLELLERDAFLITWFNQLSVPEIDLAQLSGGLGSIRSDFERMGTELRAFALATEFEVSATMALALDRTGSGPAAMIGLGCDRNPLEALRKAMFEIGQMHEPLRRRFQEGKAAKLAAYSDVGTLEQHAAYFFKAEHLHEFEFLMQRGTAPLRSRLGTNDSEARGLEALVKNVRDCGHRAFYYELTTPDLADYPIKVVRALMTGIQPIHFGHGMERLGSSRVYQGRTEATLNRCPHPLA